MDLVPIGRFSKMTRLSVKALRLYDEIGLLSPTRVDPSSGYRYYHPEQVNRAEAVRILRSVDMPLEAIRSILAADDPDDVHRQLAEHRERLAQRLAAQERMLAYLETLIQRNEGVMPYDVRIEEAKVQNVAATKVRTSLDRVADDIQRGFGTLMGALGRNQLAPIGAPLIVFHDLIDHETEGDIEICVPIAGSVEGGGEVYTRELEGGSMATTMHRGPYEQITPAYHTITGWISSQGHEIAGPPREIYLNDPRSVAPEELMTRVEFPICVSAPPNGA